MSTAKPIPAGVHVTYQLQFRKCGKPTCHCKKQGAGHGGYWYAYYRLDGKMYSTYVGKQAPAEMSPEMVARYEARAARQAQRPA